MKKAVSTILISQENIALLTDLDNKTFFSPIFQIAVTVVGNQIFHGSKSLTYITSDDDVLLWWLEYQYQAERCA